MPQNGYEGVLSYVRACIEEAEIKSGMAETLANQKIQFEPGINATIDEAAKLLRVIVHSSENFDSVRLKQKQRVEYLTDRLTKLPKKFELLRDMLRGKDTTPESVAAGWNAFYLIVQSVAPRAVINADRIVKPSAEVYAEPSWCHPWHERGAIAYKYVGDKNPNMLFLWARRNSFHPAFMSPAWDYMALLLGEIDNQSSIEAEVKKKSAEYFCKIRDELKTFDWTKLTQREHPNAG